MDGDVDGIVLGCTHFPFLLDDIRSVAPGVPVFDGAEGTARQLARVLQEHGLLEDADGKTELFSSGGEKAIALMRRMLCT
jgi:glutamate racemase